MHVWASHQRLPRVHPGGHTLALHAGTVSEDLKGNRIYLLRFLYKILLRILLASSQYAGLVRKCIQDQDCSLYCERSELNISRG